MQEIMNFAFINKEPRKASNKHVAIIGAGAAGLSSAGYLASAGHSVTVFDRLSVAGGLMTHGIPEWRIPQQNIQGGVEILQNNFGVIFHFNTKIVASLTEQSSVGDILVEHTRTVQELRETFSAVIITTGAWGERSLGIDNEGLQGVYGGIDFLYRIRAKHYTPTVEHIAVANKRVVVIGAGFTAIDVAIRAMGLGATSVSLVYRRTSKEAPAGLYEINHATKAGAVWIEKHSPVAILGKDSVEGIRFHNSAEGIDVDMECDIVIKAVGDTSTYPSLPICKEMVAEKEYSLMSKEKIYMAGDAFTGASKIGKAVRSGIITSRRLITDMEEGMQSSYFRKEIIAIRG